MALDIDVAENDTEIARRVGVATALIETRVEQDKILFGDENENPDFWTGRRRGFGDYQIFAEKVWGVPPLGREHRND